MAHSGNPAESVVALLVVLGLRIAEVPATGTLITVGRRASRLAKVSSTLIMTFRCTSNLAQTSQ